MLFIRYRKKKNDSVATRAVLAASQYPESRRRQAVVNLRFRQPDRRRSRGQFD